MTNLQTAGAEQVMNTKAIIETKSLCKSYTLGREEVPVLKDISLTVHQGDYIAIMGQSGAGKSTLLNILGCLDSPTSGEYYFKGRSVATFSQSQLADIRNREIGFVFQNFNLLPKLTIAGNVELPLIYGNISKRKRTTFINDVLTRFGLWERRKHKPNEISGGQKQRVALARALIKKPSIIFADEPTGNLDSHTTGELLKVLDELSQEGHTIVVITHEQAVAEHAEKIIQIVDGRIAS